MGTSERQKKPSVTRSFNRLLSASVLSRPRSRVRAPSSPPHIPKGLWDVWTYSDSEIWFDMGAIRSLPPVLRMFFILHFTSPRFGTIILTTLLCAARLFEFTACVYTSVGRKTCSFRQVDLKRLGFHRASGRQPKPR